MTVKTIETTCKHCGSKLSGATAFDKEDQPIIPEKGDISVCCYCLGVNIFEDDHEVRIATNEEISNLPHEIRMEINQIRQLLKNL